MTQKRARQNATNPPFESEYLNIEFNLQIIKNHGMPVHHDNPTIRSIGVVGALFDKDFNMLRKDQEIVMRAIHMIRETQISMVPLLKFHFYNLLAPISSDFLAAALLDNTAPKADAFVVCDIHYDRSGRNNFSKLRYDQQVTPYESLEWDYLLDVDAYHDKPRCVGVSHLQTSLVESWGRSADLVDAKLVFIHESGDAIETKDFVAGDFYQVAIGNEERIPSIDLGVAASNAFLTSLQAEANPNNILGQRLHALKPVEAKRAEPLSLEPALSR